MLKVKLYKNFFNGKASYKVVMDMEVRKLIEGNTVFFDKRNLKIRASEIDDNMVYKLSEHKQKSSYKGKKYEYDPTVSCFSFGANGFDDDNLGEYLIEQDGDWLIMFREIY